VNGAIRADCRSDSSFSCSRSSGPGGMSQDAPRPRPETRSGAWRPAFGGEAYSSSSPPALKPVSANEPGRPGRALPNAAGSGVSTGTSGITGSDCDSTSTSL